MKFLGLLLILPSLAHSALSFNAVPKCKAEVASTASAEGTVEIRDYVLHYQMPGIAFGAHVTCDDGVLLDRIGFVQFVLEGNARARYDGGHIEVRLGRLPAIDAYECHVPWVDFQILSQHGGEMVLRMSDRPGGSFALQAPYSANRYYPAGYRPNLLAVNRSLRLLTILVLFDADSMGFIPLKAFEWSTELELELSEVDHGSISYRIAGAKLSGPMEATTAWLRQIGPKLRFDAPTATSQQEWWWIPPETSLAKPRRIQR